MSVHAENSARAMTGAHYADVDHQVASFLESMPKHCDKHVRNVVSILFAIIGVESGSAVRSLARALKHEKMGVRLSAVIALGALGEHSAEAVSELVSALKDGEWRVRVRVAVAETLGLLGQHAATAAPVLAAVLNDGNAQLREAAVEAFAALQEHAISAIPNIVSALKNGDWWVQVAACEALAALGPNAGSVVPQLKAALKTAKKHQVRMAAVKALSAVGQSEASTVSAITEALFDKAWEVRSTARMTLADLSKDAILDLTHILRMLKNGDWWNQISAAEALGVLGSIELPVIQGLEAALKHNTQKVRTAASEALALLGQRPDSDHQPTVRNENNQTKDIFSVVDDQ